MANNSMSLPSGMGGLTHFNEEYSSKLKITPEQVIILIVAVIIGMTVLKIVF